MQQHFVALREDALANMTKALDNTLIPEVRAWWRTNNAEALLANAYLYGFTVQSPLDELADAYRSNIDALLQTGQKQPVIYHTYRVTSILKL